MQADRQTQSQQINSSAGGCMGEHDIIYRTGWSFELIHLMSRAFIRFFSQ